MVTKVQLGVKMVVVMGRGTGIVVSVDERLLMVSPIC